MHVRFIAKRLARIQAHDKKRSSNHYAPKLPYELLESKVLLAGDFNVVSESLVVDSLNPQLSEEHVLSTEGVWQNVSKDVLSSSSGTSYIQASSFSLYDLNATALQLSLSNAPLEFTPGYMDQAVIVSIPAPNNSFEQFAIVEAPIMEPALAAKFPGIKTYRGIGINDASDTVRLDFTIQGFHASVRSSSHADYYVDPFFHLENGSYMSYYTQDLIVDPVRASFAESVFSDTGDLIYSQTATDASSDTTVVEPHDVVHPSGDKDNGSGSNSDHASFGPHGSDLRTYQLAVAATGEYTSFHGGTKVAGQAAIVTAVNRVVGIYEIDVAVRMILVANNDDLVYTNAGTDPYTNNNGVAMLSQNQTNVDSVIGSANYDVGHVFSTGGGGVASLAVIGQNGAKARGVTGLPNPIGDPFYVDFVAHEMGHQYGGNHTFNGDSGSCAGGNRNGGTAYEPGSGSTIMAYAGICGNDDLQSNSDAFFHSESIDEIRNEVTTGTGNSSATITSTGNAIPTVNAGANFVIPAQTPFELTAVGSDSDSGDVLTYSWEQRDLGSQRDVNASDNGSSPIFRSWDPTTVPTRVFPRMVELLGNSTATGEQLPTTNWNTMDFRVVVRDNAAAGGGVNTDDMSLQVVDTGAGFALTSQNTLTNWTSGDTETITWNVAGTNANGINTVNVDIFFAADGMNYDTILASGVANDGSQDITVPNTSTALGRIKVKAAGNVFFDINNANIVIGVTVNQYTSTDTPVVIVDNSTVQSTITIPDDGNIADLDLQLNIAHTWDADLTVTLTAPGGAIMELFAGIGGSGDNFSNTYFDDSAANSITTGTPPFSGSYQPVDAFGPLNGMSVAGDWILSITDSATQDQGTLNTWSLFVTLVSTNTDLTSVVDANPAANQAAENATVGATVGITAFADDPDVGDTVTYSLTDDAGGLFAIDENSGVVTVAGGLDFETATSHQITIEATSTDGSMVNANFTIDVTNVDDAVLMSRQIYYRDSIFDDGDLGAVAPDKSVLNSGQTATFANYTSYWRGINGFVIDLQDLNQEPTTATVGSFFEFTVGNNDTPSGWASAPNPTVAYQSNVDANGTDRVFLTWNDNAIENTWLEITVLANATTGLTTPDVFYIGNAIGETGNDVSNAIVNLVDVSGTRANQTGFGNTDILDKFDFDRNEKVNLIDVSIARSNQSGFSPLNLITPTADASRRFSAGGTEGLENDGLGAGLVLFDNGHRIIGANSWHVSKMPAGDQLAFINENQGRVTAPDQFRLAGNESDLNSGATTGRSISEEPVGRRITLDDANAFDSFELSRFRQLDSTFGAYDF